MSRPIKFGYMLDFRNPLSAGIGFAELYAQFFQQIEHAEGAGFDTIWLTEHHFTDDGYLASILPMAAAIAARTNRIKVGTYVLLVPFYHPLKLAEDAAVIDVLSGGRLRLGLGLGYREEEFNGFGIERKQRLGRTLESVEILKRAWSGERFSFEGKYFRLNDVRVLPRPVSRPYPELLWGGMAPGAIQRGARLDLSFACNLGAREIELYRNTLRELGKNPDSYSVVNSRVVYIAESADAAWNDVKDALLYQSELYGKWLSAANGPDQNWTPDPERLRRTSVLGTPAQVTERLHDIIEQTPFTELIIVTQLPGLKPELAMRSLRRFSAEVLPRLRA